MNNKGTDQTARMRRLICAFVFAYGINRFSHDMAYIQEGKVFVGFEIQDGN